MQTLNCDIATIVDDNIADIDLVSPAESDELRDATYETESTRVKQDVYHVMARIETPRHHPYQIEFCINFRDAMFELDVEDVAAVTQVCKNKWDISFADKFLQDPEYVLQRVRRKIPAPQKLHDKLFEVF